MTEILANLNYWVTIVLMISGLYIVAAHGNMIKKLVGLSIFQTSVVGVATIALGMALVVRIHEAYGTIEDDEVHDMERE